MAASNQSSGNASKRTFGADRADNVCRVCHEPEK